MAKTVKTTPAGTKVDPETGKFPVLKARQSVNSGSPIDPILIQFIQVRPGEERGREPKRAYDSDAGHDLFCSRHIAVQPGNKANLPTGIALDLPANIFGLILPRSSTFYRKGLLVHPGIVDPGYRGEVSILVYNPPGGKSVFVEDGARLAQLILLPVLAVKFHEVQKLSPGERGEAGFGSTGGLAPEAGE